jgi:hypothetical protein
MLQIIDHTPRKVAVPLVTTFSLDREVRECHTAGLAISSIRSKMRTITNTISESIVRLTAIRYREPHTQAGQFAAASFVRR